MEVLPRKSIFLLWLTLLSTGCHATECMPYCDNPCVELNGNVQQECGACPATFACSPLHGLAAAVAAHGEAQPTTTSADDHSSSESPTYPAAASAASTAEQLPEERPLSEDPLAKLHAATLDRGLSTARYNQAVIATCPPEYHDRRQDFNSEHCKASFSVVSSSGSELLGARI